jgi:hypothetical protein
MALEQLKHPKDCPIEEDLRFQELTWIAERLGWVVMAVIVIAALFGLFGGPNARSQARDGSGRVQVEYQRFQRLLAPTELKITLEASNEAIVDVAIGEQLAGVFEIRTISPQPLESFAHDGGVLLRFAVTGENKAPVQIVMMGVPGKPGRAAGDIGLLGEAPARLNIFVYP